MNQTERLYKIEQMLSENQAVPIETLLERLEISRATFKRDLDYLRDRLHAPIVWDRGQGGYRFDGSSGRGTRAGPKHELPGLWFNSSEAYALLAMQQLLKEIEPGLLSGQVEPLKTRLRALLGSTDHDVDEVEKRIKVVQVGARHANPTLFAEVANAVLSRRQIRIAYFSRGTGEDTDRTISPQRLVNYRGSWYVDAWCHLLNDLRSFSVDSIRKADVLNDRAKTVAEKDLKEYFETSYGIFRGKASKVAKLRFTPERARWVANETWHAQQKGTFEEDGSYVLELPYHDDRELVMDVLRHGADVQALGPARSCGGRWWRRHGRWWGGTMAGDIKAMKSKVDAADYAQFLPAMKARVSHARSCAARAVNHELVLRYWDSGRGIVETGQAAGWGDAVVAQLSADLLAAFSDMRGFSAANLWRMKQIYLARTSAEFLDKGTLRADKPDMSAVEPDINRTLITITPPLPIAANGAKPLIRLCCGGSCEVA